MADTVVVGGSVTGGAAENSGEIVSAGNMGAVTVGDNLQGGPYSGTGSVNSSGFILSSRGSIASVSIGGSIVTGVATSTGSITNDGSVRAAYQLGSLTVGGSLIGDVDGDAVNPVIISAGGAAILAGYNTYPQPVNGSAQIGPVKLSGDWIASDLVAGATISYGSHPNPMVARHGSAEAGRREAERKGIYGLDVVVTGRRVAKEPALEINLP